MHQLDEKGRQILALLDQNARLPISAIAKRTRLNKDVVRYRIAKMEKESIILGYYTLIDTHKLGYFTIRVYFDLVEMRKETLRQFISYLDKDFRAAQIFSIDGAYQLGIITWEPSIYALKGKLKALKEHFDNHINDYEVAFFTEFHNYFRKYLPHVPQTVLSLKEGKAEQIDDIDKKLLLLLSTNARMTSVEISSRLKIPQRTVVYRIKRLEKKKIILGYRANINIASLGYENYFVEVYTSEQSKKSIEQWAEHHPQCIGVDYVLHGADIELEVEVESKRKLLEFINELKEKFVHIKKIRYWSTIEYLKLTYIPN